MSYLVGVASGLIDYNNLHVRDRVIIKRDIYKSLAQYCLRVEVLIHPNGGRAPQYFVVDSMGMRMGHPPHENFPDACKQILGIINDLP